MSVNMTAHNMRGGITQKVNLNDRLRILNYKDEEIEEYYKGMKYVDYTEGFREQCKLLRGNGNKNRDTCVIDGRVTINRNKYYAYHLVAHKKFGRDRLETVSSNKKGNDALTISHLCGTSNCCNEDHIVIEKKTINDERTHCHYVLGNLKKNRESIESYDLVFRNVLKTCPHEPKCAIAKEVSKGKYKTLELNSLNKKWNKRISLKKRLNEKRKSLIKKLVFRHRCNCVNINK